MQILKAIKSGVLRAVITWKGVLIIWFFLLLLISLLVIPMKGALRSGLGNSMITEKLAEGINIEVFAELGQVFSSLISFFASGFFLVLLAGFLQVDYSAHCEVPQESIYRLSSSKHLPEISGHSW